MPHRFRKYKTIPNTKLLHPILATFLLLMIHFNSNALLFSEQTEEQCHIQLEKASSFISKLQYRLTIKAQDEIIAWVKNNEEQWIKITPSTSIAMNYPIKVHHISTSHIRLELIITPFCKKQYVLERQFG